MFPGTYLQRSIKIGLVRAEIFLIWTNVARTNVAWTNVIMRVGICSRYSQEPIFKFSSKSGQLELRYSWYGQMSRGQMLPGQMSPWQLESVLDAPRNLIFEVSSKLGQLELRYSWYGQMSQGQMLPGHMSPWQLESVLDVPRNLSLKFHQNRVS